MDIDTKDIILVLVGFALSIVASAIHGWLSSRSALSKAQAEAKEKSFRAKLTGQDVLARNDAFHSIVIRASFWFILGNMMFAISGLAWVLDLTGIFGVQSILASLTSFIAVFFFGASLKWLRLYMKIKFQ